MENISYGKIVLIGAGHVGSAILDSLLRMNLADEIVVINRNQKKALGVVLDASHTTAFAYSANANIRVGTYEDCKDAQIIINTAGPSIQPGNSRDRTDHHLHPFCHYYQCFKSNGHSYLYCTEGIQLSPKSSDWYRYSSGHRPLQ